MNAEIRYYAVPDPCNPDQITLWRFNGRHLRPWPLHARYGPTLRPDDVPPELLGDERAAWIHRWYRESVQEWRTAVGFEIWRDPHGCRARFAVHTGRCGLCAARLPDRASQLCGVGPECRLGMPAIMITTLAYQTLAVLREEAERCAAR